MVQMLCDFGFATPDETSSLVGDMESRRHRAYERLDGDGPYGYEANQASFEPPDGPLRDRDPPAEPSFTPVAHEMGHNRIHNSKEQTRYLLRKQFFRWLGTAFLAGFITITFKLYAIKGVITPTQKKTFNAIITALILGLGLNFFEAFKGLARLLRWRFLADGHYSVREVDLILGIENLINVLKLGWASSRRLWMLLFCATWILLNLSAQVSVALINLTYSLNDGKDYNGTYSIPGKANVSDLSCYHRGGDCPKDHQDITQATAHSNGELATGAECGPYNTTADILSSKKDYTYFCRRTPGQQEFAYRFNEYNPKDEQETFPQFTNRIITASSGPCIEYSQVNIVLGPDLNGLMSAWNYTFTNGSYTSNIMIPVNMEAWNGTTYVFRGIRIPQNADGWSCGPRCMWMWAHKSPGAGDHSKFYQCPITVSHVSNVTDPRHDLADGMARVAASSIGLQGRFSKTSTGIVWTQYQFYPFGSTWEVHFHSADHVGANMAEFAIGSISTLAKQNPRIQLQGTVPNLGTQLEILWEYASPLLIGIAGVHFILFVTVVYASRVVIIRDDSNLSTARLLRAVTAPLASSGTLLDGKQASQALAPSATGGLVYGPKQDELSQGYYLTLGTDVKRRIDLPNRRHPEGIYL